MLTHRLGQSPLELTPVIVGAWAMGGWFWGGTDDDAAIRAIHAAIDAGVNAIDTAPMYGRGHSERVVGRALRGRRDQIQVLTKVGLRWDDTQGARFFSSSDPDGSFEVYRNLRPESIRAEVEASLRRLQTDTIDLLQCHWPDPSTPVEDTMGAMARLVEEGKIRAVGVSNFDPGLLERARQTLSQAGLPLASNQPPYSLIRQDIDRDVLPWCQRHGVGVIPYSPMERGLLTGSVGPDRVFSSSDGRKDDPLFSQQMRTRIQQALGDVADITQTHGCTHAQLALAWCLHRPGISAVIAGARTPAQARENAGAAAVALSEAEVRRLEEAFGDLRAPSGA